MTAWAYDTVDRIRIRPDIRPCDFTISDLVLLVTEPQPGRQAEDHPSHEEATR